MNWFSKIQRRFSALFRKQQLDAEMDEEIRAHIELRTQQNIGAGMAPEHARLAALRQFGWAESIKETCREQRGARWLEAFVKDLQFGARILFKNPRFTLVAVFTLALGIGANTAIFSVVDAVLLRPLPYPDSNRLVWLSERGPDWTGGSISWPNYLDWKAQQNVFDSIGVYNWNNFTLTGRGEPVQLFGSQVSADVFTALRVKPALGRVFGAEDDKPGAAPVVVLGYSVWQSRFGGDSSVPNESITLDGRPYTVVGVMPPGFAFPSDVNLWVPIGPILGNSKERGEHPGLLGLARLKDGVTLEQARAALGTIATRLSQQYPDTNRNRGVDVQQLLDNQVGNVRRALWMLLGAVALVLLIACTNVANLLLARAAGRQREIAVRAALGAAKWRIIRQLLTESVLLAFVGATTGLLFAYGALRLIAVMGQNSIPRVGEVSLNISVLLFSVAIAILVGILFGLAPAWQITRPDLQDSLKDTARGTIGTRGRLRQALVVAEVSLTLVLLVGAGLLLRSFNQLQNVNPGFGYERVLTFRVGLPEWKYKTLDREISFYQRMLEKLRAVPGVIAASVSSKLPLDANHWDTTFLIEGQPEPPPYQRPSMDVQLVGPDYFHAMGIPVLRGRVFTEQDDRGHLRGTGPEQDWTAGLNSMVIDEDFARRYWPDTNPIGQHIRLPWGEKDKNPVLTVVGVVGRVKLDRLSETGGNVQAYLPFLQAPSRGMAVVIKTALPPDTMVAAARREVLALDPDQPIYEIRTLSELHAASIAPQRLSLTLVGIFGGIALALAIVGIYGLLTYTVVQRQREIGIRMALGAQKSQLLGQFVWQGIRLCLIGVVLGLFAAFALTRLLSSLLFEVRPTDPLTFATIPLLLIGVTVLASWVPARRASRLNPTVALRAE